MEDTTLYAGHRRKRNCLVPVEQKRRKTCSKTSDIHDLPADCIAEVILHTSPRDAYRFSVTSSCFRSVPDDDFVWMSFLPSDLESILSRAVELVLHSSKKDLFFKLAERHVLIDGGKMSFGLDKSSGAKCYMLSASILDIGFAKEPHLYWRQISLPDSGFAQVAEPVMQCQLSITGKINMSTFSSRTAYIAHLVYKLIETPHDFLGKIGRSRQRACVYVGEYRTKCIVYLEPSYDKQVKNSLGGWGVSCDEIGESAKVRDDGWIEVKIGEFYSDNGGEGDVHINLEEIDSHHGQGGLIVEGIEIRAKH